MGATQSANTDSANKQTVEGICDFNPGDGYTRLIHEIKEVLVNIRKIDNTVSELRNLSKEDQLNNLLGKQEFALDFWRIRIECTEGIGFMRIESFLDSFTRNTLNDKNRYSLHEIKPFDKLTWPSTILKATSRCAKSAQPVPQAPPA
jgi:hypothetical protein